MSRSHSKCDGTWIEPYTREDGKKVDGHCRMSVRTVLHDNRKNSRQLKKILSASTKSLEIYRGLTLLETKGVLTSKQFSDQYKPFESIYKPPIKTNAQKAKK